MSMDPLITALLDLMHELPKLPQPLLVGGGFGLYVKQRHLEGQRELHTLIPGELWPPARATEDLDLLLPTEVILDAGRMRAIRATLDRLGYEPDVPNFQFVKETQQGPIRIDLLTSDIPVEHLDKVKINPPRVRPIDESSLHAYLVKEAIELGLSPYELALQGVRSDGTRAELVVRVPNAFSYLLMKLHAFRDRVDDERKNLATHHALDIYRLVAMLTRDEYELVRRLSHEHRNARPVESACMIVSEAFAGERSLGVVRLKAGARTAGLEVSSLQTGELIDVLAELFPRSRREVSE